MELRDYVKVLRAHWLGVVVVVLAALAITAVFTVTRPEVYAADANGFVTTGSATDPALASVNDAVAKSRAKSYVDIARSRATAQLVIDDLGLSATPASLISRIAVEQPLDTVLIKITARAPSPQQAQELADAWVRALAAQVAEIENPDETRAGAITRIESVEAAALPTRPVSPKPALNLGIGLAAGLLLALAYALARNQLDRRLRDPELVERNFGVPVVGAIPETSDLSHKSSELVPIVVEASPFSAPSSSAEAMRKLRTNLSYMGVDNPPRIIVITSPDQSDGKSTLAANLAAAIAIGGNPVTLVDADLRRPTVAASFGMVEGAGLTDVLAGRAIPEDVMQQHSRLSALTILAAGAVPPNPSELLGSQAMRSLLTTLAQDGIVIIDAPPLLPVTDAAVLGGSADGVLVVIRAGSTLDTELRLALDNLEAVHAKVLGIVFNRVTGRGPAGAYYGNYYQSTNTQSKARNHKTAKRRKKSDAA